MRVSVAVGTTTMCRMVAPMRHQKWPSEQLLLPQPPPHLAGHVKQTAELKDPSRKYYTRKGSGSAAIASTLFSGVKRTLRLRRRQICPVGAMLRRGSVHERPVQGEQKGRANEDESDLSEEKEALRRARLSRQITEERIEKAFCLAM